MHPESNRPRGSVSDMVTKSDGWRRNYTFKLDPKAIAWVDAEAARRGLNRAEMVRFMLRYAQGEIELRLEPEV